MIYQEEVGKTFIEEWFYKSAVPSLQEFIRIPNLSRCFDKDYKTNGLLEKAGRHIQSWVEGLQLKGLKTQFMQDEVLTPLLLTEIEGEIKDRTILFYGHFDKQPHCTGWDADKGPTTPVIKNGKLYGRGSADDGYSVYCYMLAVKALQEQKVPLPRILMIMEGDEESGNHIETYLQRLKGRLGKIDTVIILDVDIVDFEKCWITKSIRGVTDFVLKINILKEGVHSGDSSGIVPSTFKIANLLLDRLENLETGEVNQFFQRNLPSDRYQELYETAKDIGIGHFDSVRTVPGLQKVSPNPFEVLVNMGWKPTVTVAGMTGLPECPRAGNLMLPEIKLYVSMRLPPTFPQQQAQSFLRDLLTTNTPFNSSVSLEKFDIGEGWSSAPYAPWFEEIIQQSSQSVFNSKAYSISEGGGVPLVGCLAKKFPEAHILVSGVLGPNANAHGPNESLDLPYAVKLTRFLSSVVARSSQHYLSQNK